jgi:hypothetical protein
MGVHDFSLSDSKKIVDVKPVLISMAIGENQH